MRTEPWRQGHSPGLHWVFVPGLVKPINAGSAANAALIVESVNACIGAAPQLSEALRRLIEGMSVSVDVGQGPGGEERRYFGTVTEVMDDENDKHGVTLLVQDATPNF